MTEQHLVVDRTRPLDYEVFSVQEVEGLEAETTRKMIFRPLYHTRNNDEGNHGRYFSLRREPRRSSENARRYGTRTPIPARKSSCRWLISMKRPTRKICAISPSRQW